MDKKKLEIVTPMVENSTTAMLKYFIVVLYFSALFWHTHKAKPIWLQPKGHSTPYRTLSAP